MINNYYPKNSSNFNNGTITDINNGSLHVYVNGSLLLIGDYEFNNKKIALNISDKFENDF